MIHPDTELRHVSPDIGIGVFATRMIPKGTLVYVKDPLDIEVSQGQLEALDPTCRAMVEKYAYIDERGVRIVSWDHGKYVNHRCECNTISTGYGFEIALREIPAGEEITDEYGLFNMQVVIGLECGCTNCRKQVLPGDIDHYGDRWDAWVRDALRHVREVPQPLWGLVDAATRAELEGYLAGRRPYRSVRTLKWEASPATAGASRHAVTR